MRKSNGRGLDPFVDVGNFSSNGRRIEKTAIGLIVFIISFWIAVIVLIGGGLVWGYGQVKEHGLEGIGHRVWHGESCEHTVNVTNTANNIEE